MAALKPFADDLETELTCSICQEIFTKPKTLACLHSYCSKCIAQWYERSGNQVTKRFNCPICKARIDVPDGDASKLRSSFYLDSLLQLLNAMRAKSHQEQPGSLPECVSCDRHLDLVAFCPQCNGMICDECVNAHKTVKQLRVEHQATMFNDFKQENVDSFIKNQMLCSEKFHEKNRLEYYCQEETCKRCICQKCATLYHQHHDMLGIEEAAEQAKQAIRQDMKRVNELEEKYDEELVQSNLNKARIENEIDLAKQQVDDAVDTVVKMAREHRATMMKALDKMLLDQQTRNHEEKSEIDKVKKQLSEFPVRCQTLLDKSVACEILVSKEDLQQRCQTYLELPSILSSKPIQRNVTVRYVTNQEVMQSSRNIGSIVESVTDPSHCSIELLKGVRCGFFNDFMIVTRNSEGEVCHTNKGSIDVKINDIEGNEVEKKVVDEQDGKYRVSYRAEKAAPYEIQVNIGGEPIKNSPQKVNTLDVKAELEYVKTFGDDGEKLFCSISLSGNKEIAVNRFSNGTNIFNLEGEHLRGLGTVCLGSGESAKEFLPFGAVFNEDKIIVNLKCINEDGRNYSTHEFDLDFTYLRPIYELEQPFLPAGMCVTDEQNIALCCHGDEKLEVKPCIKLLSIKQGNVIQEFDSMDDENPYFITYGNGKYFVSYGENDHIRVFDKHGVFLYKFGKKGKMGGEFNSAAGLAVYGPDMILVCDGDNHRVQLLTINGQFIRSFSRLGSGQMNRPVDVAVGSNGQVFVLEFGGRVNVWRY